MSKQTILLSYAAILRLSFATTLHSQENSRHAFGRSIAANGNFLVVGDPDFQRDGDDDEDGGIRGGQAIVYRKTGSRWNKFQNLESHRNENDDDGSDPDFGESVGISGKFIAVGASDFRHEGHDDAGAVFIYQLNNPGTVFNFFQKVVNPDLDDESEFGGAISMYGKYMIVGSRNHQLWQDDDDDDDYQHFGAAVIFMNTGTAYTPQALVWPQGDDFDDNDIYYSRFGGAVAINNYWAVVGAKLFDDADDDSADDYDERHAGGVFVFKRSGTDWGYFQTIHSNDKSRNDHFGRSVSINGNFIAVGEYGENDHKGGVQMFRLKSSWWTPSQDLLTHHDGNDHDHFGQSVSLGANWMIVGADDLNPYEDDDDDADDEMETGAVVVYKRAGSLWKEVDQITLQWVFPGDDDGDDIAHNHDDDFNEDDDYYYFDDDYLQFQFGTSVLLLNDEYAMVGANNYRKGAVFVYHRYGDDWSYACPAGTYFSDYSSDVHECWNCPMDTYNELIGSTECMECPTDSVTQQEGSDSAADCIASTPTPVCSTGFTNIGDYCYMLSGKGTAEKAGVLCTDEDAWLAQFNSAAMYTTVNDAIKSWDWLTTGENYWVGAERGSALTYMWTSDGPWMGSDLPSNVWSSGEPSVVDECVVANAAQYKWDAVPCGRTKKGLCQQGKIGEQ